MPRWIDDIVQAMQNLGGQAKYEELYEEVRKVRSQPLTKEWEATVRGTVENHSSDSDNYQDARTDYFRSVYGKGKGVWALREEYRNESSVTGSHIEAAEDDRPERGIKYWALCANPDKYDIEKAVHELEVDWWGIRESDLRPGDRLLIWKTKERGQHRGVIALGEVVGEPEQRADRQNPYWKGAEQARKTQGRIRVRYEVPEGLPIWIDGPRGDLIKDLNVARARGGTVFHVEPGEWAAIARVAAEAAAVEPEASTGQGLGLTAEERKAVEMRAMKLAMEYYEAAGYHIKDVSGNSSYDLSCTKEGSELRVEVKGTTGLGEHVFLTANEVEHARSHYPNVSLFVVSEISLETGDDGPISSGGNPKIFDSWQIDDFALKPTQYSCRIP